MTQGLIIAAVGMGVVFVTLVILMVVITGFGRLFPVKEEAGEPVLEEAEDREKEVVAAISVAMASLMEEAPRRRPPAVRGGKPSPWRTFGREQLMTSRGRKSR